MWPLLTCNGWAILSFLHPQCYLVQCLGRYLIILDLSDYVYSKEETVYPYKVYPYIVFWKNMGGCLGASSANQHTYLSSYPGLTVRFCAVLWYSEWTLGMAKGTPIFCFAFGSLLIKVILQVGLLQKQTLRLYLVRGIFIKEYPWDPHLWKGGDCSRTGWRKKWRPDSEPVKALANPMGSSWARMVFWVALSWARWSGLYTPSWHGH